MSEHGQINESTKRWELIQKTIKNNDFNTVVEIGTWMGMGSTLSVLKSKNKNTEFISIESDHNFYSIAKNNLNDFKVNFKLIYGKIVEVDEVKKFADDIELSSEQKSWLNNDIINFERCPNVLNEIPEKIDFLILDGGEFSTYVEWTKLKDRSLFVALDDIGVLKCQKIYSELIDNESYTLIERTDEGHGFCIFQKID
jgi:hypothetical protein